MAGLGGSAALAFPLGGETIAIEGQPWIVNLSPQPNQVNVGLLDPVQLSMRDIETYVDLGQTHVTVGYSRIFSHGQESFENLPRTQRWSTLQGAMVGEPVITLTGDGVRIQKTSNFPQRSVFFTALDLSGKHYPSALFRARVTPEVENISPPSEGPLTRSVYPPGVLPVPVSDVHLDVVSGLIGMEYGPRNTGVYVSFINLGSISSPIPAIRICGPTSDGEASPDSIVLYNWFGTRDYFLLWNESLGEFELYAEQYGGTTRLFHTPLSGFSEYGALGTTKHGGAADLIGVYGQEGANGNRSVFHTILLSADVGHPVIGGERRGDWLVTQKSAEQVSLLGSYDPRRVPISPWFDPSISVLPSPDPLGVKKLQRGGYFRLTKNTYNTTVGLYREEPGLWCSAVDGFMFEPRFFATWSDIVQACVGMGFLIWDGLTVFDLGLFDDSRVRTVGILRKNGDPVNIAHRFTPSNPVDWSSPVKFRFSVDPRRNKLEMFTQDDYLTPGLSLPLGDRDYLPDGADGGVNGLLPFIAFGHHLPIHTMGSFDLYSLNYCHRYQAWEYRTESDPATANPPWTLVGSGSSPGSDCRVLTTAPGATLRYDRTADFDVNRGCVAEANLRVTNSKPLSRSSVYLMLDDGIQAYMLTFVDTPSGKFICVSQSSGLASFAEHPGLSGIGLKVSAPLDWSEFHTYRLERRPLDGLYVYVDYADTPLLAIPDSDHIGYPQSIFSLPKVAFGHLTTEGATSEWRCLRTFCSSGYEFSVRKNQPDAVLMDQLFGTEAVVLARTTDDD
jgi:hypothetical protein